MTLPDKLFAFLWHFIKRQPYAFAAILLTSLTWAANEAIFPYLIKLIVNGVSQLNSNTGDIFYVLRDPLLAIFFFWVIMETCMRIQGWVILHAFPKFRANMRQAVFDYVRGHSHTYFANHFAGSISSKISDIPSSAERLIEIIIFNFIAILAMLLISLILLWHTRPIFAFIMLIWLVVHLGTMMLFMRKGNTLAEIHSESVATLSGKIVDTLTNILNVRLFARGAFESQYLATFQADEIKKSKAAFVVLEKMKIILGIAGLGLIFAMIYTLIYGWGQHWVTLGDFTLVTMLSFSMLGMLWFVSYQISIYVREANKIRAALNLVSVEHEIQDVKNAKPLIIKKGVILFDRVCFSYQPKMLVFKDLSVTIQPGERVGLVGLSGSGKSTFVNLILRFFDIRSGTIAIDSQNIAEVTRESLRKQIAMIPQDPSLFHRTLMQNIRYGNLNATDEEVIVAAKMAHCHEFIDQLDEGYEALVGERGVKLSGGQRQRIAIARAMLKNAPILILDEATSSLDSITEKLIQGSLETLMKNRTTLIVAHRLSTLSAVDRILVFDEGKIVEDADMETLLKNKAYFSKLWHMQHDGFLPD